MKSHKTAQKDRAFYTYQFDDGRKVTLKPGEEGVTEETIKLLHSLDDAEVYNNNKNWKRYISEKEKKEWKEKHPNEDYSDKWNLSTDSFYEKDGNQDKCIYMGDNTSLEDKVIGENEVDFILSQMTDKQQEVCRLFMDGYLQTDIAKKLGVSDASISKHKRKIEEKLKNYFKRG